MGIPFNGITLNQNAVDVLSILKNNTPDGAERKKTLLDNMGSSNKTWAQLPADVVRLYSQLVYTHPEILTAKTAEEKANRAKILGTYAQYIYPNDPEAKNLLANKLNNGLNNYALELSAKLSVPLVETNFTYFDPGKLIPKPTAQETYEASAPPNLGNNFNIEDVINSAIEQRGNFTEAQKRDYENKLAAINVAISKAGLVADPNYGVGKVSPTADVARSYTPPTELGTAPSQPKIKESYSTGAASSEKPSQILNSWILSWEPNQKIGIVKVPLQKILEKSNSLGLIDSYNEFEDILLQNLVDVADFSKVKGRIFLPLSANKMVIIKEFSMVRKNIQQTEITHGSRYFQVFTESFPEFSLQIIAVKFADIAKKVKLFFDNTMKRISETSRYSGSFYLYDVIGENIPAYSVTELGTRLNNGTFTRYRLLPRSVRFQISADDPNAVNITVDGIIVEWEKQDEALKIAAKQTSKTTTPSKGDKATDSNILGTPNKPNAVNGAADAAAAAGATAKGIASSESSLEEETNKAVKLTVLLTQITTKYKTSAAVRNITPQEIKKIQALGFSYIEKGDIIGVLDAYYYNKNKTPDALIFSSQELVRKNNKRIPSSGGYGGP